MTRVLTSKTKYRKPFLVRDKDSLVEITQPGVTDTAVLYAILLEKIKNSVHKFSKY